MTGTIYEGLLLARSSIRHFCEPSITDQRTSSMVNEDSIDFLLTWNCRHIANAAILKELHTILARFDCEIPTICTPEELFGE